MEKKEVLSDLSSLIEQLEKWKVDFDEAISIGKNFIEVKMIHLQIKELRRLIEQSREKTDKEQSTQALSH